MCLIKLIHQIKLIEEINLSLLIICKFTFHLLDGIQALRKSVMDPSQDLPNPRVLSNLITSHIVSRRRKLRDPNPEIQRTDDIVNQLFVFYGQFLDHDVSNSFPMPVTQ